MWIKRILTTIIIILTLVNLFLYMYERQSRPKFGYIDVEQVFNGFHLKKELQQKFQSVHDARKRVLDSIGFELQVENKNLQSSPNSDKKKMLSFLQRKDEYLERLDKFKKDSDEMSVSYDEQIVSQLNQYVQDYGKENGFTYIFGTGGSGTLMYAEEAQNVTQGVMEYLNQKYVGKKTN